MSAPAASPAVNTGSKKWKKSFLDALSHSQYFQSGFATYRTTGLWRLRVPDNPWLMEEENPGVRIAYARDEPLSPHAGTTLLVGPGRPVPPPRTSDNFYELQMQLRDAYTRTYTKTQQQLTLSDAEIQRSHSFDRKMQLLHQVEVVKRVRAGVLFLLTTLVNNEQKYKDAKLYAEQRFSGTLFFIIPF